MIHQMAMSPVSHPVSACRRLVVATAMATFVVVATTLAAPAQTVVVVVNGEPITALDVESRTKFTHLSTQKQPARPDVINELIDEKLKIREGKRWGIEHTDAEVDSMYANMASRMHQSADQLTQNLQKGGVNPQTLKTKIRADSVWQQLVRGRYSASLQLSEKDIEIALEAKHQSGQSTTAIEYVMRPILFLVPPGAQPATIDAKRKEAEALRARFKSCEEGLVTARATGAVVRDQVIRNSGDLNPELLKILDAVPIGQLTAPEVTRHGIEMWAICGKQDSKADAPIKKQTREALANERFEQQSKAYLQRLRREALIERK
jgi:peptidyl-prolyl cis-trans isomerase SurA